jgi:hypothetical protein
MLGEDAPVQVRLDDAGYPVDAASDDDQRHEPLPVALGG